MSPDSIKKLMHAEQFGAFDFPHAGGLTLSARGADRVAAMTPGRMEARSS